MHNDFSSHKVESELIKCKRSVKSIFSGGVIELSLNH